MPGVFVGTPVAVRETDETVSFEFTVERVYAGEIGARTVVSTPSDGAACGTGFAEGVEQVVVVSDRAVAGVDGPGDWNADMCSGGMFALQDGTRLDPRAAVEEALGTGEPPADIETTLAGERTREMARPLIAAVVLAALVGVGVFARRAWRARSG
ncbi:hypothetical protein [Dietzia sp. 179-F 9C3 NHS]|uniref:hypothetical protein n=1 Tax=Dietzia sp. 179-F 9C3 NHS TaxID=3374295 RepID=UPI003879FAD5